MGDQARNQPNSGEGGPNAGRWAGDEIVVVGDYCDSGLYTTVQEDDEYREISNVVRDEFNQWIGMEDMAV